MWMRWMVLVLVMTGHSLAMGAPSCTNCSTAQSANSLNCPVRLNGCQIPASLVNGCPASCATGGPCPPQCPGGPPGPPGPPGPSGPPGTGAGGLQADRDGAFRLGKWCEDIPSLRGIPVKLNTMGCGRNGDIYTATTVGVTAPTRPLGLPFEEGGLHVGDLVPAGATVYADWANWNNMGIAFTVTSTGSCELGAAAPTWCKTVGCTVTSGTCTLTGFAFTSGTWNFQDGSVTWTGSGADIGAGGNAGPTARSEDNLPFPRTNSERHWGDNEQPPLLLGRGDYGGPDETVFVAGSWGDARSGSPGTQIQGGFPGFMVSGGISLGIATAPALVLEQQAGPIPTNQWGCFSLEWENSLGGTTRAGIHVRCISASQGGITVSMPERDGWHWPTPFPAGETMGRVYQTMLPGAPCTPLPGQQTCDLVLPKQAFMIVMDYLYGPGDSINVIPANLWERDSPANENSTGTATSPFMVYQQDVGWAVPFTAGMMVTVGTPLRPVPDVGWVFDVYGIHCTCDAQGRHARGCVRDRSPQVPLPASWPTTLPSDRVPVCLPNDPNGIAIQRGAPTNTGMIWHEFQDSFLFRIQRPLFNGVAWENRDVAAWKQGTLLFFGPGGVNDIRWRCGATSLNGGPGCGP